MEGRASLLLPKAYKIPKYVSGWVRLQDERLFPYFNVIHAKITDIHTNKLFYYLWLTIIYNIFLARRFTAGKLRARKVGSVTLLAPLLQDPRLCGNGSVLRNPVFLILLYRTDNRFVRYECGVFWGKTFKIYNTGVTRENFKLKMNTDEKKYERWQFANT